MSTPYMEITCGIRPTSLAEFDAAHYLAANADVAAAGADPRDHFLRHGLAEGRMQWVASPELAATRDAKLARVRFSRPPEVSRSPGAAANYLPAAAAATLRMPDALPLSSHAYADHVVAMLRANPDKLFLDLGAGMSPRYHSNVVTTEIYSWPSTDVVCMGEDLPFEDDQFDVVFCLAVLEHTLQPWEVAREICRVLKPGGQAIIDWPFLQPMHGFPHHYFNATIQGVRSLFEPYCEIVQASVGRNEGPVYAVSWILELWRNGLPSTTAAAFEETRVGELIRRDKEEQLALPYCRDLDPAVQPVIAAGTSLVAVKRPGLTVFPASADAARRLQVENAALLDQIAAMRRSTSWRMTAPLRRLRRLLHG